MRENYIQSIRMIAIVLLMLGVAACNGNRLVALPPGYEPREGDVVFQALPHMDLVDTIECVTHSPYSHCGIVNQVDGKWCVIEAIGPVVQTPLERWIARGREGWVDVFRPEDRFSGKLPAVIQAARGYLDRPYDFRYRMDDEALYCSELVYKSFRAATGEEFGALVKLGDLDWKPFQETIRKYEGGDPPLDRLMITPRDLAKASQLRPVYQHATK